MRTAQWTWSEGNGWSGERFTGGAANLVLYFGSRKALAEPARFDELRAIFPNAHILGCSTGGQIQNDDIVDDTITAVAIRFDKTRLKLVCESIAGAASRVPVAQRSGVRSRPTILPAFSCCPMDSTSMAARWSQALPKSSATTCR